jgi:Mrp family chromosome partitioning ATPase
LDEIAAKLS